MVTIGGLRVSQFGQLVDLRTAMHFEKVTSTLTQIKTRFGCDVVFNQRTCKTLAYFAKVGPPHRRPSCRRMRLVSVGGLEQGDLD